MASLSHWTLYSLLYMYLFTCWMHVWPTTLETHLVWPWLLQLEGWLAQCQRDCPVQPNDTIIILLHMHTWPYTYFCCRMLWRYHWWWWVHFGWGGGPGWNKGLGWNKILALLQDWLRDTLIDTSCFLKMVYKLLFCFFCKAQITIDLA